MKRHAVAQEHAVFDRDAFTDEGVTGNFAVLAHGGILLNLDERADFGVVAHRASVQIDELRQLDVLSQALRLARCRRNSFIAG